MSSHFIISLQQGGRTGGKVWALTLMVISVISGLRKAGYRSYAGQQGGLFLRSSGPFPLEQEKEGMRFFCPVAKGLWLRLVYFWAHIGS